MSNTLKSRTLDVLATDSLPVINLAETGSLEAGDSDTIDILHLQNDQFFKLYHADKVPPFLKEPHIHQGYRHGLSLRECISSIFHIHNQTGNIWSHLVPLCLFVWRISMFLGWVSTFEETPLMDVLIMGVFYVGAVGCMFGSVMFHLCRCVSEDHYRWFYSCDVVGILGLIMASYIPGLYFAFYCQPLLQTVYTSLICVVAVVVMIVLTFPRFQDMKYHGIKTKLLIGMICGSIIPILHFLYGNPASDISQLLSRLICMLFFYGLGFSFYATKFPESSYPGHFDIWCHSHQLWHLSVACAALIWEANMLNAYVFRNTQPCDVI